jgi:hypothetical protein
VLLFALAASLIASGRPGRAEELNAGLPHDTLAFLEMDPGAGPGKAGGGNALLDVGLEAMQSFGVLPKEAALVGDILGMATVGGNRRSCVALLDADLGVIGEKGLACKSVQLAWVIDNGGGAKEARDMVERLTKLLAHVTTPATARQTIRKSAEGKREYVEFRDNKWPEWMVLAWVQDGGHFVLTFGTGAMEHYLAGRPVGGAPWVESLRAADTEAGRLGSSGMIMARVYVSAKAFRERFPEAMNKTVLGRMFDSLGFGGTAGAKEKVDAGLLSARGKERTISLDGGTVSAGKVTVTPWTVPLAVDSPLLKLVPAEASAYLALRMDWGNVYGRTLSLMDAIFTDPTDRPLEKQVAIFAGKYQVDVRRDILSKLQPIVVVHDWPPHPLRLPLMVTAVGAVAPGEREKVEKAMGALMAGAGETLDRKAAAKGGEAGAGGAKDLMRFRVRRDKDGVTYLQFGLVGPAWTWVEDRLVFSWSPTAVRVNVPLAKGIRAGAFGEPGR